MHAGTHLLPAALAAAVDVCCVKSTPPSPLLTLLAAIDVPPSPAGGTVVKLRLVPRFAHPNKLLPTF